MKKNLEFIGEQLKKLTAIPSPSGYTEKAAEYLMETLKEMGYEPELSNKGNVLVNIGGKGNPLILASHVDTLGAMVRSIKDNGRLRPTTLGGHQWRTADGENCTVHTRDGRVYTGVVLNTEPSSHVADEKVEQKEENMEILLDENVDSKDDIKALGIQVGDIIAMDPRTVITESGYIKSRFLDDKLSAAILLGLAPCLNMLLCLPVLLPVAVFFTAAGLLLGTVCSEKAVSGAASLLVNVAAWLSGIWFDLSLIGGVFEQICRFLPFAAAVQAAQLALAGDWAGALEPFLLTLLWSGLLLGLTVWLFHRRVSAPA